MKKMGFFGVAVATTFIGDVTLALAVGLETLRGKSFDPFFHGAVLSSSAGGAGKGLLCGDHVIGSGGMEGKLGCEGAVGVCFWEFVPHELRIESPASSKPHSVSPAHAMRPVDGTATLIGLNLDEFVYTNRQPKSGGETGGYNGDYKQTTYVPLWWFQVMSNNTASTVLMLRQCLTAKSLA